MTSQKHTKTYVVIPNWNGMDMLGACLDSLLAQSEPCRIVVVDNGSEDGSIELLHSGYPDVHLIQRDKNYGFTGGVNPGIDYALEQGAEYVALFNNDALADHHWLKHLVACADTHPEAGIVTCKFLMMDRRHLDSTGDFYSIWGLLFPRGRNQVDTGQFDDQREIFGATGGASLYRCKMLQEIGTFDDDFFAYFEDGDISFRAQLAGWKVRYEPAAKAYHHLSATSSRLGDFARFHSTKNLVLLFFKDMPPGLFAKYLPLFCLQYTRMFLSSCVRGKPHVFVKGSWAAIRLRGSTRAKRRKVQAVRRVDNRYIESILYHKWPPRPPIITKENQ
jgi:GT2 family glycosyltransferase